MEVSPAAASTRRDVKLATAAPPRAVTTPTANSSTAVRAAANWRTDPAA